MSSFNLYLLCFIVPLIIGLAVQGWLRKTFADNSQKPVASGKSGADVAREILDRNGLQNVPVQPSKAGPLSDHYDPRARVVVIAERPGLRRLHGHVLQAVAIEDLASHVGAALAAGHRLLAVVGEGLAQPALYGQTDDQGHDKAQEIQVERTHGGGSPRLCRGGGAMNRAGVLYPAEAPGSREPHGRRRTKTGGEPCRPAARRVRRSRSCSRSSVSYTHL